MASRLYASIEGFPLTRASCAAKAHWQQVSAQPPQVASIAIPMLGSNTSALRVIQVPRRIMSRLEYTDVWRLLQSRPCDPAIC